MQKQDLTKFVGIPFKFLGVDYDGLDCIGLCQLFYKEHGYDIEFRDGKPITKDWYETAPTRMWKWFCKKCDKIENIYDLQYGDIVVFEIGGENHTSIYIGDFKVLTILEIYKKSMIVHLNKCEVLYRCGFRFKNIKE